MHWRKLGRIFGPDGHQPWALAHAMLPTPLMLDDDRVRVYVAHTDVNTVGRVGYVDVSLSNPAQVLAYAEKPLMDIGEPGMFDDNGVNPCCILRDGGRYLLYYVGYQLQRKVPYTLFTGVSSSNSPDGPFTRISQAPILDRIEGEFFFRTAPFVMRDGGIWRMWYIGGDGWTTSPAGKVLPLYSMRTIESADGITWAGPGHECLAPRRPEELGFGRPFIMRDSASYKMWYSIRTVEGYRIGYAVSPDGCHWTRKDDEAGISPSETGWDSEMICYSAIVPYKSGLVMFYNGNGYGRSGVGVAVAEVS